MSEKKWELQNNRTEDSENEVVHDAKFVEELERLWISFVRVISAAIDARTPYNASHSRNMVRVGTNFLNYLNQINHPWQFSDSKRKQFLMSVWLHDIGKLVIPLEVMNKGSRLAPHMERMENRFLEIDLRQRLKLATGEWSKEKYEAEKAKREDAWELIVVANRTGIVSEEAEVKLQGFKACYYEDDVGNRKPWIKEEEYDCLCIKRGTLTATERDVMEKHVDYTEKFLSEIEFNREYDHVYRWAIAHHELLDGSGYPNHLKGDEIPKEVRLMTILDIFDSLVADDRPYKAAIPLERALEILDSMAKQEGKLDAELLELFKQSEAWK